MKSNELYNGREIKDRWVLVVIAVSALAYYFIAVGALTYYYGPAIGIAAALAPIIFGYALILLMDRLNLNHNQW